MPYRIHRNGNNRSWTVLSKTPDGWRKSAQYDCLYTDRIDFLISEAGHQRVLREGTRNVHAWAVVDEYTELPREEIVLAEHRISYTPYNDRGFWCEALDNIGMAEQCIFHTDGLIYAMNVS